MISSLKEYIDSKYLVAKFTFDELSGNVIDTTCGYVGTITGATRVTGWNGIGSALNFAGGTNRVNVPHKIFPTGKIAIRFKVKSTQSTGYGDLLTNGVYSANYGITIQLANGNLVFFASKGTSGVNNFLTYSNKSVTDGQWHDILCYWDGTTNANGVKIYVDDMNVPDVQGTALVSNNTIGTYDLRIGIASDDISYPFIGQLDELEIYKEDISTLLQSKDLVLQNKTTFKNYSLDNQTLISLPNTSSKNMILHGVPQNKEIDLTTNFNKKNYVQDTPTILTNGKVFSTKVTKANTIKVGEI